MYRKSKSKQQTLCHVELLNDVIEPVTLARTGPGGGGGGGGGGDVCTISGAHKRREAAPRSVQQLRTAMS